MFICFAAMTTMTISGSNNAKDDAAGEMYNYTREQLITGYILVIFLSFLWAINCTLNRALKGIHSGIIMFWHGVLGIIMAIIAIVIDYAVKDAGTGNGL